MAELVKAHAKALTPSFGDGKEDQYMIESLTQEVTTLLRKSEKKLKKLSEGGPSEDSNIRKNVQVRLLWLVKFLIALWEVLLYSNKSSAGFLFIHSISLTY